MRFGVLFRALRVLRRIALWGARALVALILAAFAINAFDERSSPEALALLHPPENRYKPDENAYLSLAGFDAPAGQSVTTVGQARIAHYNERVDLMLRDPFLGLEALTTDDPLTLKLVGSVDFLRPPDPTFWEIVHANGGKIQQLIDQNHDLYQRYLGLFDMPGYYETARPSHMAPLVYAAPSQVRKLFLAGVSVRLQSRDPGQTQIALNSLRQDIDLWHRMLTGEGTLLSKMIAVAYLQTDSLILSDMIADPGAAVPQNMEPYLPQIELSDWNIRSAFAAEFRVHTFLYQQTQAIIDNHWQPPDASRASRLWNRFLSPIEGHFYKINATENLSAKIMTELAGFAALDPSNFSTEQARFKKWKQASTDIFSVRSVYNPIGRVLVAIAAPAYENYILRPYDAAALQRLVRLSFEIRRQRIPPSEIAEFMKLHPEWSTHPADGRPFVWKPATSEIAIQPVARQPEDRRFSVRIWKRSDG